MGVLDTHILKSIARKEVLVDQSVQVGIKCVVQTKVMKFLIDNIFITFFHQQCLEYSNMCYLLWSHAEFGIAISIFLH